MRVVSMFVTKDHFIFIVNSNEVNDELYAAEGLPAGNPIGFLSEGNASTFKKTNLNSSWELYSSNHNSPNLHVRSQNSLFGAVAETDNVVYVNIIPREDANLGEWKNINNANENENNAIQNTDTAFQLGAQCLVDVTRDINTFEIISSSTSITESDIDISF